MSLTKAKMGGEKGNLKAQLEQEEKDALAELEAIAKEKAKASKKSKKDD